MNIEIRKLTPDLLEDYLNFFETKAHADNEDEDRCYCVCSFMILWVLLTCIKGAVLFFMKKLNISSLCENI
jgi:hypothetical protein